LLTWRERRGIIFVLPVILFIAIYVVLRVMPGYELLRTGEEGNYLLYRYGPVVLNILLTALIASVILPPIVIVIRLITRKRIDGWDVLVGALDIAAGILIVLTLIGPSIGDLGGEEYIDSIEAEDHVYHLYHLWHIGFYWGDCFNDEPTCSQLRSKKHYLHSFVVLKCNIAQTNCRNVYSSKELDFGTSGYTFDIHFRYDEVIGQVTVVDGEGRRVAAIP
jgi:hypothetical protein